MNTQGSQATEQQHPGEQRPDDTIAHGGPRKEDTKTGSGPNPLEEHHRTRKKVSGQDDELHDHQGKDRDPIERAPTDEHVKARWNGHGQRGQDLG